MGFILNFLKKLFPTAFSWLAKFALGFIMPILAPLIQAIASLLRKIGIFLLILAAIGLAITAVAEALDFLMNQIVTLVPREIRDLIKIGQMLLPSNLSFCISLLVFLRIQSLIFYWVTKLSEKLIHT